MSKAFDTIDHTTLLQKMEHYGIRGSALNLIKSYLSDRMKFAEIDTSRSKLRQSLDCSVIQGSKMSGLLYTIYTNEIPLLHTLMNKPIFNKLTNMPQAISKTILHLTINFVDDSTNVISTPNVDEIKDYINKFYSLLEAVYNTNKLIINKDKTEMMIVCKNKFRKITKAIQMYANGYKVNQVQQAKILGFTIQSNLKHNK